MKQDYNKKDQVTRAFENKIHQILEKVANTVDKLKIAKISTSKLHLRVQNIYIKPVTLK